MKIGAFAIYFMMKGGEAKWTRRTIARIVRIGRTNSVLY